MLLNNPFQTSWNEGENEKLHCIRSGSKGGWLRCPVRRDTDPGLLRQMPERLTTSAAPYPNLKSPPWAQKQPTTYAEGHSHTCMNKNYFNSPHTGYSPNPKMRVTDVPHATDRPTPGPDVPVAEGMHRRSGRSIYRVSAPRHRTIACKTSSCRTSHTAMLPGRYYPDDEACRGALPVGMRRAALFFYANPHCAEPSFSRLST